MPQSSRSYAAPVRTTDDLRICGVSFDERSVRVTLMNRRAFDLDLQCYPELMRARFDERMGWMLVDGGHGLAWPMLGLGSSAVEGLINSRELVRQASAPRLVGAPAVGI